MKTLLIVIGLTAATPVFSAETSTPAKGDKTQYTLWNPTPRELMREMSTDRPDLTESPYTVDAGHFQIEADLLSYAGDRHNPDFSRTHAESWSIGHANLKLGLCNSTDLQMVVPTYNRVRVKDRSTGTVTEEEGFGDLITRLKMNLFGNDDGKVALALMPFVKFPTAKKSLGNNAFEGGLIVPLAVELPQGWGMGAMTEVDILEDGDGSGYHPEFINTITFSHDLIGDLGGYVEFFSAVSTESDSEWIGTANLGLTYAVSDDLQLDCGVNFGLTRAAEDINPFVGVSWRY